MTLLRELYQIVEVAPVQGLDGCTDPGLRAIASYLTLEKNVVLSLEFGRIDYLRRKEKTPARMAKMAVRMLKICVS